MKKLIKRITEAGIIVATARIMPMAINYANTFRGRTDQYGAEWLIPGIALFLLILIEGE